jgi:hypothetical protein
MKKVTNELSFLLVTRTTHFGIRFWSLRQFQALLQFWTRDGQIKKQVFGQVFRPQNE